MIELTPRQNEVFEAIKIHIEKAGFPPTMLELAGLIGCASPNAAVEHVKSLKKKVTSLLLPVLPGHYHRQNGMGCRSSNDHQRPAIRWRQGQR